jgi:SAM-dependent methyltransferase
MAEENLQEFNPDDLTFWDHHIGTWRYYERSYGEGVGVASRILIADLVRQGESYLDVGCGPGCGFENLAVHASHKDLTYIGCDIAPSAIRDCKKMFPEEKFPWADFVMADAMELEKSFQPQSFDIVTLRHVLDHVPDYKPPIEAACKIARRMVYIVLWRLLSEHPQRQEYEEGGKKGYSVTWHKEEFLEFCRNTGWHVMYIRCEEPGKPNDVLIMRNPEHLTNDARYGLKIDSTGWAK